MPAIAAKPFLFKSEFKIGDDIYTSHTTLAEFNPTQQTVSVTDIGGVTTGFGGLSSWTFDIAGLQDWETLNSLSSYLNSHEGEVATVSVSSPGGIHTGEVVLAAVKVGGKGNAVAEFAKSMTTKSAPVFTPTPGP